MSSGKRLLRKFLENPYSLKFRQIKKLLMYLGFELVPAKGSHVKFSHPAIIETLVIPVHHNDCKKFFKKDVATIIIKYKLYEKNSQMLSYDE